MQINTDENSINENSDTISMKSFSLAHKSESSAARGTRKNSSSSVQSNTSVSAINGDDSNKN